jgi:hypothetical protein
MDDKSRLQLDKLIKEYNPENTTSKIRELKHSKKIRDDITRMQQLKQTHSRIKQSSPGTFRSMCETQCSFLFRNYTNIFNKLFKDEINLNIMEQFLHVLYNIEEGHLDQHEGSYKVGQILKELYIDSALKQEQKDKKKRSEYENKKSKGKKNTSNAPKKLSWAEYKMLHTID